MKKKRGRQWLSLIMVFTLVFNILSYMGAATAEAGCDPYVYENPAWNGDAATLGDIVQKITYVPTQNGNFGIKAYLDVSHLDSQEIYYNAEFLEYECINTDGQKVFGVVDGITNLDFLDARFETGLIDLGLEPGKDWSIRFYISDIYYEWDNPVFSWIKHTAPELKDENEPEDPVTPPDVPSSATEIKDKTVDITDINKNHYGQTVYSESFYLDSSISNFKVALKHLVLEPSDKNWELTLTDPSGKVLGQVGNGAGQTVEWGSLDETESGFTTAGKYTLKLVCGYSGLGTIGYRLTINSKKVIGYSYKYMKATAVEQSDGSYLIQGDQYDGNDVPYTRIYRENLKTGKFMLIASDTEWAYDDTNKAPDTTYKYYVVNYDKLTAKDLPYGDDEVEISSVTKAELEKYSATVTIKTPAFQVAAVTDLKVKTRGVMFAELEWFWDNRNFDGFLVQTFDSKGNLTCTTTFANGQEEGNIMDIPYVGKSTIKVTAYYIYDGETLYGPSAEVETSSLKLSARSVNITKISSKNARITVYGGIGEIQVQQKVGSKWKDITEFVNSYHYKQTWKKNNAGKSTYRVRTYIEDQGKKHYTSWKTFKPKSNSKTYTKYSVKYMRDTHGYGDVYFLPTKVEYKGSKIKVTGRFYNTWQIARDSGKIKITYKADDKTIGYKTISVKNMKPNSYKTYSFYLSNSQKNADLRCASYTLTTIE